MDRRYFERTTMNRRSMFTFSAIATLGLALLPSSIVAQQGTLKQQLVGTWTLVGFEFIAANGTKEQLANPKGILMFDAGGRYAFVAARGDRPKYKIADQPTAEEIVAATEDFFAANFGTWSVNEADKTLTRHYDAALRPNNDGQDFKSSVSLMGDELRLTGQTLPGGFRIDTVHRRAR
jgi:hypothetical protein